MTGARFVDFRFFPEDSGYSKWTEGYLLKSVILFFSISRFLSAELVVGLQS